MNNIIKYGVSGIIVSGKSKGWFIRIEENEKDLGSYLILVSEDREFSKNANGYDYWPENTIEVQEFFKEINWVVEWFD